MLDNPIERLLNILIRQTQIKPRASSIRLSSGPVVSLPARAPLFEAQIPAPTYGEPKETVPTLLFAVTCDRELLSFVLQTKAAWTVSHEHICHGVFCY